MKTKFFLVIFFAALLIIVGCGKSAEQEEKKQTEKTESSIVRDYNVNVASLDENKDGKVFQCPMDWEVISDEVGKCPLCNMNLKEFLVEDAQKNLEENRP
jgi:hypothetical protein